tara:strand:- start:4114 stop:4497 length:384 start_codon:yes stop_codon:yes gene_type:complete
MRVVQFSPKHKKSRLRPSSFFLLLLSPFGFFLYGTGLKPKFFLTSGVVSWLLARGVSAHIPFFPFFFSFLSFFPFQISSYFLAPFLNSFSLSLSLTLSLSRARAHSSISEERKEEPRSVPVSERDPS